MILQVVDMCWSQRLYDAMIHVYNYAMHDYTTPLLEFLLQLRDSIKKGKALTGDIINTLRSLASCITVYHYYFFFPLDVGNKLLVYIRYM